MAVAGVTNNLERHVNPLVEQRIEQATAPGQAAKENAAANTVAEDTYTPSDNSAQASAQGAGIFQLNPAVVAANTTTAQSVADQNAAPAQAAAPTADSVANVTQQTTATGAQAPQITATTDSTETQGQVQSLNNALAALGLSRTDIEQIDRIATLIQNFDPASYTDLVNQFQRQAQQAQQLAAPANAGAANPAPAQTAAPANAGGYQLQGISISYAGPTSLNAGNGSAGSGAGNPPTAQGQVQIQQVQFNLVNGSGQTFQVQAPQQNTYAGTPNLQTPQTHSNAA